MNCPDATIVAPDGTFGEIFVATIKSTMIQSLYLGRVSYEEALRLQAEVATLVGEGRLHNVLLLLEHPPVLTLGRNADRANILASDQLLITRGVTVHEINRGGDVTYHGPGQLVGYPIFNLRTLHTASGGRMGPVDFVRGMEEALIRLCGSFGVSAGRIRGLTGVWCGSTGNREQETGNKGQDEECLHDQIGSGGPSRKIAAIGIHVARGITSHGFAFNVTTDLNDFALIVPCGIADHAVTSLQQELQSSASLPTLEAIAHQAAQYFGQVFAEQVQAVESLVQLRALAAAATAQFPAEDTPLQLPSEVEHLLGGVERPARA
jgi:lipoyl(octanoyl) transferase